MAAGRGDLLQPPQASRLLLCSQYDVFGLREVAGVEWTPRIRNLESAAERVPQLMPCKDMGMDPRTSASLNPGQRAAPAGSCVVVLELRSISHVAYACCGRRHDCACNVWLGTGPIRLDLRARACFISLIPHPSVDACPTKAVIALVRYLHVCDSLRSRVAC